MLSLMILFKWIQVNYRLLRIKINQGTEKFCRNMFILSEPSTTHSSMRARTLHDLGNQRGRRMDQQLGLDSILIKDKYRLILPSRNPIAQPRSQPLHDCRRYSDSQDLEGLRGGGWQGRSRTQAMGADSMAR